MRDVVGNLTHLQQLGRHGVSVSGLFVTQRTTLLGIPSGSPRRAEQMEVQAHLGQVLSGTARLSSAME
ncbi:hypothetical protein PFLUV_G00271070 [Perca fluviatilis]|uniref:Uncharacterized protein n=1 Tax=Perca fluviatilis TaxID=8168 RepID=A0A6A5DWD5_PERFL|nr:hypothetical protein PFLUV_G00271070 [Perca fluviatilis]